MTSTSKKKGVKLIIAGSRECNDYELVKDIIEKGISELKIEKISEVVSGAANGVDSLGEEWARRHGYNVVTFPADWKNLKAPNAIIKERYNKWTKKNEKYNANAGFQRNKEMAEYADALIAINFNTPGTDNMVKMAKNQGILVYEYKPEPMKDDEFDYKF